MSKPPKLILASTSARRAEILRNAGFDFEVFPYSVDEAHSPREEAPVYVWRVAALKARTAASRLRAKRQKDVAVIVAADTVVALDGDILGKPGSTEDARKMLRRLSARWHEVFTGLAVLLPRSSDQMSVGVERTRVEFAPLSATEIDEYIETGEPFDKAGGYGIQGQGGRFVRRIEGCYFNVMGLPLSRLYTLLAELKVK